MRPHSLAVRGFRSYAGEQQFDFAGRGLVGIVGPIGSGKSSLLDAVTFALYGETPTVGRNNTRSLINQRSQSGHVELIFEVGGQRWRAVRAQRRKGQGAHHLERLAGDGETVVEAVDGRDDVTARVVELLGLDFSAFRHSVLLAQNQFARFLQARPGDRDAVLKGLFSFDRIDLMQVAAKERHAAAEHDLGELERRRADIESDRARLVAAGEELAAASARVEALRAVEPEVVAVEAAIAAAVAEGAAAAEARRALDGHQAALPAEEECAEIAEVRDRALAALTAAEESLTKAEEALAAADRALADVDASWGDEEALLAATELVTRLASLDEGLADAEQRSQAAAGSAAGAETALAERRRAVFAAREAAAAAGAALAEAEQATEAAATRHHDAEHAAMAETLRASLAVGEPCPVCLQEVAEPVATGPPADVAAAKDARERAARTREEARRVERAAAAAVATATGAEEEAERSAIAAARAASAAMAGADEARRRREEVAVAVAALTPAGVEPARHMEQWRRAREEATRRRGETDADARAARHGVDEARRLAAERAAATDRLRAALLRVAAVVSADLDDEDGATLSQLRSSVATALSRRADAAEEAEKAAQRRIEDGQGDLAELLRPLRLAPGVGFDEEVARARERAAGLRREVELLEERVARLAELERDNQELLSKRLVFRRLAHDLSPSRFLRFLLDEERVELARLGGEHLQMLSAGRYRFSDDGVFDILDLAAADARRAPESLSGGETFLASLALALALAELAGRQGGRVDSFFLDEGFGSLDPEHLDLAMDGVERLVAAAPNRLVLVVSHVPALRQRFEDVIALDKDPVTGDTRVG